MIASPMFAVPASSLLFATRRDPFAVSSTTLTLGTSAIPNSLCLLPADHPLAESGEQKGQNLANLAKPHKMNTCRNRATTLVK
jgi:hypothetical protein